ncbi:MAG: hypothetical protein R3F11_16490 [Verrucomicrobiales bacterium]
MRRSYQRLCLATAALLAAAVALPVWSESAIGFGWLPAGVLASALGLALYAGMRESALFGGGAAHRGVAFSGTAAFYGAAALSCCCCAATSCRRWIGRTRCWRARRWRCYGGCWRGR